MILVAPPERESRPTTAEEASSRPAQPSTTTVEPSRPAEPSSRPAEPSTTTVEPSTTTVEPSTTTVESSRPAPVEPSRPAPVEPSRPAEPLTMTTTSTTMPGDYAKNLFAFAFALGATLSSAIFYYCIVLFVALQDTQQVILKLQ